MGCMHLDGKGCLNDKVDSEYCDFIGDFDSCNEYESDDVCEGCNADFNLEEDCTCEADCSECGYSVRFCECCEECGYYQCECCTDCGYYECQCEETCDCEDE